MFAAEIWRFSVALSIAGIRHNKFIRRKVPRDVGEFILSLRFALYIPI